MTALDVAARELQPMAVARVRETVAKMRDAEGGLLTTARRVGLKSFKNTFLANEAIAWLLKTNVRCFLASDGSVCAKPGGGCVSGAYYD